MKLQSIRRFYGENGSYLLVARLLDSPLGFVRNQFISKRLRVKKINIGPRYYLRGLSSVCMGEDFSAGEGFWMDAISRYKDQSFSPRIIIGNHVRISQWVHIAATHYVDIGDNVLIGSKVIITDHNHGQYSREHTSPHVAPTLRPLDHDRRVSIGRNVWIGDGVVVTPGSMIGEGSVIGANSVVKGTIPPFTIAAGSPARPLKQYDFTLREWVRIQ